jgi:hypothetical protein
MKSFGNIFGETRSAGTPRARWVFSLAAARAVDIFCSGPRAQDMSVTEDARGNYLFGEAANARASHLEATLKAAAVYFARS